MTVMRDPIDPNTLRAAIDDCLSGLENVPSRRAEILTHAKGAAKVKKKFSAGVALAIILTVLMASVAVAASLGLFEQMTTQWDADVRLGDLATVAKPVGATFTTPEGVTLTIDQAYYDGTRVFLSYIKTGPIQQAELGEGTPDVTEWDFVEPDTIFSRQWSMDGKEGERITAWLDGSAPRWARVKTVSTHDGLELADGTYCEIIGGTFYEQPDGSWIGWKECTVPEEAAADEITVCIGMFNTDNLYYQTEDTLYTQHSSNAREATWYPITVKKSTDTRTLTGSVSGEGWTATANLSLNAIDLRGSVTVTCPTSWNDWWWDSVSDGALEGDPDVLREWKLYIDGQPAEGYDLDGSNGGRTSGQLDFGICWRTGGATEGFTLVPCFRKSGERPDLAMPLVFAD